ncbi:MAG: MFS transporter [Chloroflexota bacterium]|nr:MFS transporter [Chloroflexota bacterium]
MSSFGTAFTDFALPLLVFRLTGSPVALAGAASALLLPNLLFGLFIGAWTDRLERRPLMIRLDLARAVVVSTIPLVSLAGGLSVPFILAVIVVHQTLTIFYEACNIGAVVSLLQRDQLVVGNSRVEASNQGATVVGPLVAAALILFMPLESVFVFDAATFAFSAVLLWRIARSFNRMRTRPSQHIAREVIEGLRFYFGHPVLAGISYFIAAVNFFGATREAQLVYFAKTRFAVTDSQVGVLYAVGGLALAALTLLAPAIRRRIGYGGAMIGTIAASGILTLLLAVAPSYPVAVLLWAATWGFYGAFPMVALSVRQAVTPDHLLGRVATIARVFRRSPALPGTIIGGFAVEATGNISLVYFVIGSAVLVICAGFWLASPLRHADAYVVAHDAEPTAGAQSIPPVL